MGSKDALLPTEADDWAWTAAKNRTSVVRGYVCDKKLVTVLTGSTAMVRLPKCV